MLRWSADRLTVGLAPQHVLLTRRRRAQIIDVQRIDFAAQLAQAVQPAQAADAAADAHPWQPAITALQDAFATQTYAGCHAEVVVSHAFARFAVL